MQAKSAIWNVVDTETYTLRFTHISCTNICTNNPYLRTLERRCADVVAHSHQQTWGQSRTGESRTSEAAAYPEMMARAYAQAIRAAWVHNSRPAAAVIPEITLQQFQADVALDPRTCAPRREPPAEELPVFDQPIQMTTSLFTQRPSAESLRDFWTEVENTRHIAPK